MLQGTPEAKRRARELRKNMSLPEVLLWQRLKLRPEGLKFRPQHGAGDYILDFYCHEQRVVIEIDGISHEMGDRAFRDEERDGWLTSKGLRVIRIPAVHVLRNPDDAAEAIVAATKSFHDNEAPRFSAQ